MRSRGAPIRREWTPEQLDERSPEWIAAFVTWLGGPESAWVTGRVFEAWGKGYSVIEGWQHGPQSAPSKDPAELGPRINEIVKFARANAGIDRNSWVAD